MELKKYTIIIIANQEMSTTLEGAELNENAVKQLILDVQQANGDIRVDEPIETTNGLITIEPNEEIENKPLASWYCRVCGYVNQAMINTSKEFLHEDISEAKANKEKESDSELKFNTGLTGAAICAVGGAAIGYVLGRIFK